MIFGVDFLRHPCYRTPSQQKFPRPNAFLPLWNSTDILVSSDKKMNKLRIEKNKVMFF